MRLSIVLVLAAASVAAQSQSFDVISVKRSAPDAPEALFSTSGPGIIVLRAGGRFWAPAATVRQLLRVAYGVDDIQIIGGPKWTADDQFQIDATTRSDVSGAEVRAMLRTLLQDRFNLAAHIETRELPVYLLVRAHSDGRLGEQLRPSGTDCAPPLSPPRLGPGGATGAVAPPPPPPPPPPGGSSAGRAMLLSHTPPRCGNPRMLPGFLSTRESTMAFLAAQLVPLVERPVLDRTGLAGAFDVDLVYAPDGATPFATASNAPPLFTATREQLGLRLEASRAPVDVLVINRVELPTEN
jgi:uncharacterized protein (TIGR03435 family)